MTYLQMINNLLQRLRERTVSTSSASSYSSLIGILINDAKREVQDAWDWNVLRQDLTITTSASTTNYALGTSDYRVVEHQVFNDTTDYELKYIPSSMMRQWLWDDQAAEGEPKYYSFGDVDANGYTTVNLYPIPDDVYSIKAHVTLREPDFSADSDETYLPSQPIVMLAYAKAIEERGEDAGVNSSSAYVTANRVLNDAISLDAAKYPEKTIWVEV